MAGCGRGQVIAYSTRGFFCSTDVNLTAPHWRKAVATVRDFSHRASLSAASLPSYQVILTKPTAVNAPLDEFWRAIKLDLYGTFLGCRCGIPELIEAGGGSVINMSSKIALMGVAGRDCYTAAKGGIAAITRSFAIAYAPQRVRVNAIAPSATMTERVKKLVAGNAAPTQLADSHLLGLIEPDDIASMALYLASDESRMVTGQVLPVDSGVTIS